MPDNRTIKLADRLALIITKLVSQRRISVSELAKSSHCHPRTIHRDIERLMQQDVDKGPALLIDKVNSDIYALSEENYKSFITMDKVLEFASVLSWRSFLPEMNLNLILNGDLKDTVTFFNTPIEDIRKEKERHKGALQLNHSTYNRNVDNKPRKGRISNDIKENRNNVTTFTKLMEFCKSGTVIEIEYLKRGAENAKDYKVQPYQLVNYKGIWYLMAVHDDMIKSFTFVKIRKITPLSKKFKRDKAILQKIRKWGTISAESTERLKEVVLKVKDFGVDYFERIDNMLPNISEKVMLEDGTLEIRCVDLHPNDVLSVVGQWIPWVTIISPVELRKEFERRIDAWRDSQKADDEAAVPDESQAPKE